MFPSPSSPRLSHKERVALVVRQAYGNKHFYKKEVKKQIKAGHGSHAFMSVAQ
jgi:hypothetical protein